MANTFIPIASTTLGSAQPTITFSGISNAYDDLVIVCSLLSTGGAQPDNLRLAFNGDTAANYANNTWSVKSANLPNVSYNNAQTILTQNNGVGTGSSTFSMSYIYIAGYKAAFSKAVYINTGHGRFGNSGAETFEIFSGHIWTNTAAITSVAISCVANLATNSSAHLYGIKRT